MKTALLAFLFLSLNAHASEDFLTRGEIENSSLNQTEKGMAMVALLSQPVVTCVSTNEGLGADSERLQIYFLEIGNVFKAGVAIWKTRTELKVFGSFDDASSLKAAYAQGQSSTFGSEAGGFADAALKVQYSALIPLLGKAATLQFANGAVAEQICSVAK